MLVHESLVPPEKIKNKEEWAIAEWKTEYDVVNGLKQGGHKVNVLGVGNDLKTIKETIEQFKPKIIFNLLEEFAGEAVYDQNVVSYLELIGVKYTGCGPQGLMLARDKSIAKKILSFHRISTPKFYVFKKNKKTKIPKDIKYPLFVKTLNEEASLGITQDSIVNSKEQLVERIKYFHEKIQADVIAEDYIKGRELYVGVIGNDRLQVLPPWELFFKKTSDRVPKIATSKVKWDHRYRKKYGINTGKAKELTEEQIKEISSICRRAYRALGLNGYGRMDLRLDESNKLYLIEANPNPDIGYCEDLSDSAEDIGIDYPHLLNKILRLGLKY